MLMRLLVITIAHRALEKHTCIPTTHLHQVMHNYDELEIKDIGKFSLGLYIYIVFRPLLILTKLSGSKY